MPSRRPFSKHAKTGLGNDDQLIVRARAGDETAVAELYAAHRAVAVGVARRLCRPSDVDDVVSEAFTKVIDQLARGGGPKVSFRAYLLTAVRSVSADVGRGQARLLPTDTVEDLQDPRGFRPQDQPHSAIRSDSELLATALASLPARWQQVVWWTVVEDRPLAEVGDKLGLNTNAVAALSFRARQGLRNAYLALHVARASDPDCEPWRSDFPAFASGRLAQHRVDDIVTHLLDCLPCYEVVDELRSLVAAGATHPG